MYSNSLGPLFNGVYSGPLFNGVCSGPLMVFAMSLRMISVFLLYSTASQVLLSTLCVPIEPVPSETDRFLEVDDNSRDKARRLAALLRMDTPPSRATLMKDIVRI